MQWLFYIAQDLRAAEPPLILQPRDELSHAWQQLYHLPHAEDTASVFDILSDLFKPSKHATGR